jgi:hypothetical protein
MVPTSREAGDDSGLGQLPHTLAGALVAQGDHPVHASGHLGPPSAASPPGSQERLPGVDAYVILKPCG